MEYVYGAMLLHAAGQQVSEEHLKKVMVASGAKVDEAKIKALVAALDGVNIEEAIKTAAPVAAGGAAPAAGGKKEEKKKEEKKEEKTEEEAASGLASLFG
jgi:large subunit ribosomal protein L12